MDILEAFEEAINRNNADCCTPSAMKQIRYRYNQGASIGHSTFLKILECQGYIITVVKDDDPEMIRKIISQ